MNRKLFVALFVAVSIACINPKSVIATDFDINGQPIVMIPSGSHRVYDSDISTNEATQIICTSSNTTLTIDAVHIDLSLSGINLCALTFNGTGNELVVINESVLISSDNRPGISVEGTTSLLVRGTGIINATGGREAAGIGSGNGLNSGTIIISGDVTINSTAGIDGAGIGSGNNGTSGAIIVNSGTITATSTANGAGIGSGNLGSTGSITINSGTIRAYSNTDGAGIGGGDGVSATLITINGGTIYAESQDRGAGIGGGALGNGGTIIITGGTIEEARSSQGAGIGSGTDSGIDSGTIEISGGKVYAISDFTGAGIGGGSNSSISSIIISGGQIIGSSSNGSGIGSGNLSTGGNLQIDGNAFVAAGGSGGIGFDIGGLDSIIIGDYAEVFTESGTINPLPTTSHTLEPGDRLPISNTDLTGIGSAYNFVSPTFVGPWETSCDAGYFIERVSVNPATGDNSDDYSLLILLPFTLFSFLYLFIKKKKVSKS